MPWGGVEARERYRITFRSVLPRLVGHDCLTIGRTIHVRRTRISAYLHAHEYRHVEQYATLGWFRFYWRYLRDLIRYGYANHPFERDAHAYGLAHEANFAVVEARQ